MTSYGIWDGGSCDHCVEQNCYVDNGVDDETPCPHCGWFRGLFDGSRYPPGYCASSWRCATERIRNLRGEFPGVPKEVISEHVRAAGENDMEAKGARNSLLAHQSSNKLCQQHPGVKQEDFLFALSLLQDQKEGKHEYRGDFVDDWTMEDMETIALAAARKMSDARAKSERGRAEESCDTEFISDVTGWSFDPQFDSAISGCVIDIVLATTGCFQCKKENPTKTCSNCKLAKYCSKACQALSWKDEEEPHKKTCGDFAGGITKGESGFVIINKLYTHCLLEGVGALEMALSRRTIPFLEEVVKCSSASWRGDMARHLFNLEVSIMPAFHGKAFLTANAMFLDDKKQAGFDSVDKNSGICIAHGVLFKVLDSGLKEEYFRPRFEAGDIPDGLKLATIAHLSGFLQAARERGVTVGCITCSDGARWLYKKKWKRKLCLASTGCKVSLHNPENSELGSDADDDEPEECCIS